MIISETAPAKINLALHVRRRREDGYHDLETLFAFAEDGDIVSVMPPRSDDDAESIVVECNRAEDLPADHGDNLVFRAARALRHRFGIAEPVRLFLDKRLPVAAGLGGGSADAAATLRLLCRLWSIAPDDPGVLAIASELGADAPACLIGRTCRGDAKGDQLSPVDGASVAGMPLLLVNPRLPCPTGPVFAAWDGMDRGALGRGDVLSVARAGRNDLEGPAVALVPQIAPVLAALEATAPELARMSGSGATCFALYSSESARDAASTAISAQFPAYWQMASRVAG